MIYCPNEIERGCVLPESWEGTQQFTVCPTCLIPLVVDGSTARAMTAAELREPKMREHIDLIRGAFETVLRRPFAD